MAVDGDYDQYVLNSHEEAMKETRVAVAKIEANRDIETEKIKAAKEIKVAKVNNQDRKYVQCFLGLFLLVALVVGCITYGTTRPQTPEQIQNDKDKYELCMKVENDAASC